MRAARAHASALRLAQQPSTTWPAVASTLCRTHAPHTSPLLTPRRHQSAVAAAVRAAQTYLSGGVGSGNDRASPPLPGGVQVDPFRSVAKEMKFLTTNIRSLLGSGHPVLETVSKYYTQSEGKHIRPMLVLLMSQATAKIPRAPNGTLPAASPSVDAPISPLAVLADENPSHPAASASSFSDYISTNDSSSSSSPSSSSSSSSSSAAASASDDILPSQRRLAEIAELIHTASLLHDDVIDISTSRRDAPSANLAFGNKMAVLAGDFLLGRASVALARLRHPEVTELLATVIANLIEGEFMQLRNTALDEARPRFDPASTLDYYLRKTYLKSASLISKSCRAAALLGGLHGPPVDAAYAYGKNLGVAFQLVDDMLDFTRSARELGKPAGADLELGLATAPLLFTWRQHPELGELVGRKFERPGDVARVSPLPSASWAAIPLPAQVRVPFSTTRLTRDVQIP